MPYQRNHLQFTAQYIVEKFRYDASQEKLQTLTAAAKRHWKDELFAALTPLSKRDHSKIIISPDSKDLTAFFALLAANKILFPKGTTYRLERTGKTYERYNSDDKCIYDRQKIRAKVKASRLSELDQQLREELSLDDDDSSSESSYETQPHYTPRYRDSSIPSNAFVKEADPIPPRLFSAAKL